MNNNVLKKIHKIKNTKTFRRQDVYYLVAIRFAIHHDVILRDEYGNDAKAYEKFIASRMKLFVDNIENSLLNQAKSFHCIALLVSEEFYELAKREISKNKKAEELCKLLICNQVGMLGINSALVEYADMIPKSYSYVSISRMDSDDYFGRLFLNVLDYVYSEFDVHGESVIDFPVGSIYNTQTKEARLFISPSTFFTIYSDRENVRTPYEKSHIEYIDNEHYVPIYTDRPIWSYIRHGSNIGGIREDYYLLLDRDSFRECVDV